MPLCRRSMKNGLISCRTLRREISSQHRKIREEADKQAEQAKKKAAQYEKKLTEIAPMVKEMERFAEKYSADPDEVLPEAGTLETGKSYREKESKAVDQEDRDGTAVSLSGLSRSFQKIQ